MNTNFKSLPPFVRNIFEKENFSKSEKKGLSLLTDNDLMVYCPGISTGGIAEIKMALDNPNRKIVATTIDTKGIEEVESYILNAGLEKRISVKYEDVSNKLKYSEDTIDFIYARLLLHYLTKTKLDNALTELFRILKPKKNIYCC